MLKSWRLGTLFGFPIELNLSFLMLLGLVYVAYGRLLGVLVVCLAFAFVVMHELGHAIVARRLGVGVAGIELGFLGGAAKLTNLPRTARHELMIAAAGPAVSLILGGAFIGLGGTLGSRFVVDMGWINLVIAGFNLIPALPMDGGRILRALLVPRFGYVRATDLAVAVARVAAVGFVMLGLVTQRYQLLVLAPFLWLMGTRERQIARMVPDERSSRYGADGVEVLGRDAWTHRDARGARGWGSPFDPRSRRGYGGSGDGVQRYAIVRRDGRMVVVPID